MSQWDRNRRPFEHCQDGYNETLFNNSSLSTTNSHLNQDEFYNYDQQFTQNYYVPMPNCAVTANGSYATYPNSNQYDAYLELNSYNQTMADENGHMAASSLQKSDMQAGSSTIINSKLTPLAKEFTPSLSNNIQHNNTFYDDKGKKQGAIKKGTYWNKEKRNRNENRQNFESSDDRYFKHSNENVFNKNREYHKSSYTNSYRNNSKDFNKSLEQNKILQETKKFLEQVKNIGENKGKDDEMQTQKNVVESNNSNYNFNKNSKGDSSYKNDFSQYENSKTELEPDGNRFNKQGNYYGKGNYNNRNRNYKNPYKRDYNGQYENKNRDHQSHDKKYKNENNKTKYQDVERKRENDHQGNEGKYESSRNKTHTEIFEKKRSEFQYLKKKRKYSILVLFS